MPALLYRELPGIETPERAVANDRRVVTSSDAVGHFRLRVVPPIVRADGVVVGFVRPPAPRDLHPTEIVTHHAHGSSL